MRITDDVGCREMHTVLTVGLKFDAELILLLNADT